MEALSILAGLQEASKNLAAVKARLEYVRAGLEHAKTQFPDLTATLDAQIAEIDAKLAAISAVSPESILALAGVLPAEVVNIVHGHIDPRDHASSGG